MEWDEPEFNYFMSLDDMTKVYYMHDYLFGELEDDDFEDGDFDEPMFEFTPETEDKPKTTKVSVILDLDSLWITCDNEKLMNETIRMFQMDGLMLELEESFQDTRKYRVIKQGPAISLN